MKSSICPVCREVYNKLAPQMVACSDQCFRTRRSIRSSLKRHERRVKGAPERRVTADEWLTVLWIYKFTCAYCHISPADTIDHVIPLSQMGRHHISNLVPACLYCNHDKGVRSRQEYMDDRNTPIFEQLVKEYMNA